jgi:plasmid stabilization system protein ParE
MSDLPKRYALRYSPRALRDLESAIVDFADFTGDEQKALQLRDGIRACAAILAENPDRNQVDEHETVLLRFPVRHELYRFSRKSRVAYYLYYRVTEDEDGPRVLILHIRHASRAPLTSDEAREILAQQ